MSPLDLPRLTDPAVAPLVPVFTSIEFNRTVDRPLELDVALEGPSHYKIITRAWDRATDKILEWEFNVTNPDAVLREMPVDIFDARWLKNIGARTEEG